MKGKKILGIVLAAGFVSASLLIAVRCQAPPSVETPAVSGNIPLTQYVSIGIDGNPITIDTYAQGSWYDAPQLTTEREMTITASEFTGYEMAVNGIPIESGGSVSIRLEQLNWYWGIEISTTDVNTQAVRSNYIRTLPTGYVNATVLSDKPETGYYYFNLENYIYKLDTSGNVVFFKSVIGADGLSGGLDFKRTEVDGKVYYSYLSANTPPNRAFLSGVGYARCYATVLDENYNEIDRVLYLLPDNGAPEGQPLENHQFTILGEKHYLLSSYVGKRVTNIPEDVPHSRLGARVVACVLQEIKDGTLVWQWDSTEHPELYGMSMEGNDFFNETVQWADYAHFNAIFVDPRDNNFLCSFRNLDAILKLDRETGEILWVLGGKKDQFGLTEQQKFLRQHDVQITKDGGLTLFNNGNVDSSWTDGATSILKFYLNEETRSVTGFESFAVERSFSNCMGSAQELSDGHYIIGWGGRATQLPLFSEIDFRTNRVLFEFSYPITGSSYRVYKADA